MMMRAFLANLRPRQWTKNLLLFAGVIFAQKLGHPECVTRAVLGAVVFCFASGVIYVFNDIVDRELDRRHPHKKLRPIASGRLPVAWAARAGGVLLVLSTSGNSPNCVRAVEQARASGLRSHGFLGRDGGKLRALVDGAIIAPSDHTPRIQEVHIFLGHLLCELLEAERRSA